jgi:hypothetical protein
MAKVCTLDVRVKRAFWLMPSITALKYLAAIRLLSKSHALALATWLMHRGITAEVVPSKAGGAEQISATL